MLVMFSYVTFTEKSNKKDLHSKDESVTLALKMNKIEEPKNQIGREILLNQSYSKNFFL